MSGIPRRSLAVLAVFLAVPLLAAQEAPPQTEPADDDAAASEDASSFPSGIEQVVVDVVVTDDRGRPVRGLTREDFVIEEDGVRQDVLSFEAVDLPRQDVVPEEPEPRPDGPPPRRVTVNTDPLEKSGRTFVIVFDDVHMGLTSVSPAKAAVASFLREATREGDRVTLISTSGDTWWSERMVGGRERLVDLVKRLEPRRLGEVSTDRISDWEALQIHVYQNMQAYGRVLRRFQTYNAAFLRQDRTVADADLLQDPYIMRRAAETYFAATARLKVTMATLERVLEGLAPAKGRKSVILVSDGFIYDPARSGYERVAEASRRANAAIYFVNTKGLGGMPTGMTAEFGGVMNESDVGMAFVDAIDAVAGAEETASASGGFVVSNTNDLASGIQRIANEMQAYYLLGYESTNTARDGAFREIEVELVADRDREVRARRGYHAPSDADEPERDDGIDPVIQAALDSPWAQDEIPLRMTHYVGDERVPSRAAVLVATEVDVRGFDFEDADGRFGGDLELLLVVAHRESGEFLRVDEKVVMNVLPETRERLEREWYPIVRDFDLRPGDYQAKIVVRESRSGRVGTVLHEFRVPGFDDLRISTPVLSDTLADEVAMDGVPGGRLEVIVRREFPQGSDVYCQIDVLGAAKDGPTGMPRVFQAYTVRRWDGTPFTGAPPTEIRPTSLGALSRVSGFSLKDAEPGEYEIEMKVWDELAEQGLVVRESFEVTPAVESPPDTAAAR